MRLPLAKVYRAFPELDRFTNEECELYVTQATSGSFRRWVQRAVLQVGAAVGAFFVWMLVATMIFGMMGGVRVRGGVPGVLAVAILAGFIAVPALCGLLARDIWLRRAVCARLKSARCPACEYSMLGLPVVAGVAMCPECGQALVLEKLGLTPADLLSPAETA